MKKQSLKSVQREVSIDDETIKSHPKNPRRGNISAIKDSIKGNGYYPTIFIQESSGYIVKGNHTWKALKELYAAGFEEFARIVINVLDITDEEALRIVLADNTASDYGSYGNEDLFNILEEISKTDTGFAGTLWSEKDFDDLGFHLNKKPNATPENPITDEEVKERLEETPSVEVLKKETEIHLDYNVQFVCEPNFDIPMLDLNLQVEKLEMPFMIWSMQRTSKALPRGEVGTLAFYADDTAFESIWKNPNKIVEQKVRNVVEVNFSTDFQYPMAYCLWQTYRKRWLACYWQSKGIRVMADLCVNHKFQEINFLGIPKGWRSYCDRGNIYAVEWYKSNFEKAKEHAGTDDIIYMIYGGGQVIKELCSENRWLWIPDEKTLIHGKERDSLEKAEKAITALKTQTSEKSETPQSELDKGSEAEAS